MTAGTGAVALLGLVVAGCAPIRNVGFRTPEVALDGVRPTGLSPEGGALELALRVRNPNGFAIEGRQLDLELEVEGVSLGRLTVHTAFRLPAEGDTVLHAPFSFRWAGVGEAARAALLSGEVAYRMRGGVHLGTPYDSGPVPFDRSGRFRLSERDPAPGGDSARPREVRRFDV